FVDRESPEVIFSMGGNYTPQMLNDQFSGISVSKGLQEMFSNGDLRKVFYITYLGSDNEVWDCNKYVPQESRQNANVSEIYVFRTAEAWLNLAEAEACLGGSHEGNARKALDELRKNRIQRSQWQATTLAGDALIQEIRNERRRELCFEGHRWFDLRRYTVCEKAPFKGSIQNTYSVREDMYEMSSTSTYELSAGDPAWTLQIPYEVLQYEELTPNPRNERVPISVTRW
ncbi:MAG: RagB/SusD family nutrient uptake outer membrane protein, partial [Odoribacter sp.]|nr:RagB/SusD family nutrient uptake outer membrane protein [Odoribacter sp.]